MFSFSSFTWDNFISFLTVGCPDGSPCVYWILGAAYFVLAIAALVQFVRIQIRLAESGWTLQKAFHLFNVIVCICRGVTLFIWHEFSGEEYKTAQLVLFDIPTLMFFTTYTLLALFWSEIVHSASTEVRMLPPRYAYLTLNFVVYLVVVITWVVSLLEPEKTIASSISTWFQFSMNLLVAAIFAKFGASLYFLLDNSPVAPEFKRRKMIEVATVGTLCILCFLGKAVVLVVSRFQGHGAEYDDNLVINVVLLGVTEVLVVATALGLLSDLPPKAPAQSQGGYQPIE